MENCDIAAPKLAVPPNHSDSNDAQFCWICFGTSKEDKLAEWVKPCKCSGTVRWVHQNCLQRWVEEKQRGNYLRPVQCPHCLTEYIIILPRMGIVLSILNEVNEMVQTFCPFLAAGLGVMILYWTSVTYGAITVLQVMGLDEGMKLLEETQPLALIIGLPAIPVGLILSQFLKWDDMIISNIRNEPLSTSPDIDEDSSSQLNIQSTNQTSGARILCSALLLPTVSAIVGRIFKSVESSVVKTILGGLSFIAAKGTLRIILQHSEFIRKRHKRILDYNENNLLEYVNNRTSTTSSDSGSLVGSNTSMELLVIENLMQM